jgi:hypothetical protein
MVTKGEASLELLGHFGYEILYETETEKIASGSLAEQPRILGLTHDDKHVSLEGHVSAPTRSTSRAFRSRLTRAR